MLSVGRILLTGIYHEKPRPGVGMEGRCKEIVAHLSVVIYNLIFAVTCNSPFLTMVQIQYVKVLYLVSIIIWLNSRETRAVSSLKRALRGLTAGESGSRGGWWAWWRNWDLLPLEAILTPPPPLAGSKKWNLFFLSLEVQTQKEKDQRTRIQSNLKSPV